MILPDINLLLYAYNRQAPQHELARDWWESVLNGRELIGIPHEVALGFVRIATNPRMGAMAISLVDASAVVTSWGTASVCRTLLPEVDHVAKVSKLLQRSGASGQLTSDASLAVYAMDARATLCSNDTDFARFPGLVWENPLLK